MSCKPFCRRRIGLAGIPRRPVRRHFSCGAANAHGIDCKNTMMKPVFSIAAAALSAMLALAVPASADPVDEGVSQLRAQGYVIVEIRKTWLGRVRIEAAKGGREREVVFDRFTGEIRRDYVRDTSGGGIDLAHPDRNSRDGRGASEGNSGQGAGNSSSRSGRDDGGSGSGKSGHDDSRDKNRSERDSQRDKDRSERDDRRDEDRSRRDDQRDRDRSERDEDNDRSGSSHDDDDRGGGDRSSHGGGKGKSGRDKDDD